MSCAALGWGIYGVEGKGGVPLIMLHGLELLTSNKSHIGEDLLI